MSQFQVILSTLSQLKASIEAIEKQVAQMANPVNQEAAYHQFANWPTTQVAPTLPFTPNAPTLPFTYQHPTVQEAARKAVAATQVLSGTPNMPIGLPKKRISPFAKMPDCFVPPPNGFKTPPSTPFSKTLPTQVAPTLSTQVAPTPNMPIRLKKPPANPFENTPIPFPSLEDSPILSNGQAREYLRNCTFNLSSTGYRLKEPSFEVRKNCLKKAVEQFTYPEVLLKLSSLWYVWKENNVAVYVNRLYEDINELQRSRKVVDNSEVKVHLSPYGYSIKENSNTIRFQALDKALQHFKKEFVLKHLTQITHIWIAKLSFAQFRKNQPKINEYSQYVQNLTTDYSYVFDKLS